MFPGRAKVLVETWLVDSFDDDRFREDVLQEISREFPSPRVITDEFGFKTVRYDVEVRSNNWEWELLLLAEKFCRYSKRNGAPALLEMSQDVFFGEYFNPIDEHIPLQSIAIGSLTNSFSFREHHVQDSFFRRDKQGREVNCMTATFEHDNEVIKIRFHEKQKALADDHRGLRHVENHISVDLNIFYKQIQRVIVDVNQDGMLHLYLYLTYPPEVRSYDQRQKRTKRVTTWKDQELRRIIAECPVFRMELRNYPERAVYNILGRLRKLTNNAIEFASVSSHRRWNVPKRLDVANIDHSVLYLFEAILSRGAIVKDALYQKNLWDRFMEFFVAKHRSEPEVALAALELVLAYVTEARNIRPLETVYQELWKRAKADFEIKSNANKALMREGYQYVRKVIVTPSRHLLMAPELVMGNRGLRDFKKKDSEVIRVQFRDENGDKLRENRTGRELIEATVGETTKNGLTVAGVRYEFFGNSGSQMRDNGCYCFATSIIDEVRKRIGVFPEGTSIPKRMSRIGQFFTQAQRVTNNVERKNYRQGSNECFDIVGGKDETGAPYTFSDGVGMISQKYAEEISNSSNLNLRGHVPSCFQFRLRGMKGVLAVNPILDEMRKRTEYDLYFCIRPSQAKFMAPRKKKAGAPLEIVKYSSPCGVSFNRPFLNIIDQVSELQSALTHHRIVMRVHELMDQQISSLVKALTSEKECREKLTEMPLSIDVSKLSHQIGFQLTSEPFFRSLLQAFCRLSIKKLRIKNSIAIPTNLGRTVFGVIDEMGQLQYGQVFCQITSNSFLKNPTKAARKQVLTGKVLVTKNPAIVGGDVRVFEAVDVPELRHLVDVIVFPRYGPRPHPDEMAGSDLDGDEYVIIWDQKLIFDHNQPAMNYPKSTKKASGVKEERILEESSNFFVDYVRNDSVGKLAVRHLAASDVLGIESKASLNIAKKHSKALDFPKTGDPPDDRDQEPGEHLDWIPDFLEKRAQPSCRTPGLNGQIYRRAQTLDDILRKSMSKNLEQPVEIDDDMIYSGREEFDELAKQHFANYGAQITAVMEKFGVEDEAQLFSGAIFEVRTRLATMENDPYGAFNVFANIERIVTSIVMSFRSAFFKICDEEIGEEDLADFVCEAPTEKMRKLASAYYVVAYEAALDTSRRSDSRRLLSFAWIVWDVLADVKKSAFYKRSMKERTTLSISPFATKISHHMAEYCSEMREDMDSFMDVLSNTNPLLDRLCHRYVGLNEIFFFLCMWAEENELFTDTSVLQFDSFCKLMILFGLRRFNCPNIGLHDAWFDDDFEENQEKTDLKDLHMRFGGVGAFVVSFLEFLGSREFNDLKVIGFSSLYCTSCIDGAELKALHKAASTTHSEMIFGNSTYPLPQTSQGRTSSPAAKRYEERPFAISLPRPSIRENYTKDQIEELQELIIKKTGVAHLALRQVKKYRVSACVTMVVSSIGSLDALERLKNLLIGELPSRGEHNIRWCEENLARMILKRTGFVFNHQT